MTYAQSIYDVQLYEQSFYLICYEAENGDDADIGTALERLHKAKADHEAQFGKLEKHRYHWS